MNDHIQIIYMYKDIYVGGSTYPKITAFHSMMLLSWGAPLIPAGGSCCNLLKSRIRRLRDGVDMLSDPNPKHTKTDTQTEREIESFDKGKLLAIIESRLPSFLVRGG